MSLKFNMTSFYLNVSSHFAAYPGGAGLKYFYFKLLEAILLLIHYNIKVWDCIPLIYLMQNTGFEKHLYNYFFNHVTNPMQKKLMYLYKHYTSDK
jgi:hypothetical protein